MPADNDLETAAVLARTLGDHNRLRILLAIADEQKSVSRIVEEMGISQPLVSHHLKELRRTLLVTVQRRGPFVLYQLADRKILSIIQSITELAADLINRRKGL